MSVVVGLMGNIRQSYIKSLATALLEKYGDAFSFDFESNKEAVTKYTSIESKVIRNRVAGYITHRKRVLSGK